MRNLFCFNCQKEVKSRQIFKWHFCSQCWCYLKDSDNGFYRICDACGANMPANAEYCRKCRLLFDGSGKRKQSMFVLQNMRKNGWGWLIDGITLFLAVLIGLGVLYISFYLILVFFFIGLVYWIFNILRGQ